MYYASLVDNPALIKSLSIIKVKFKTNRQPVVSITLFIKGKIFTKYALYNDNAIRHNYKVDKNIN